MFRIALLNLLRRPVRGILAISGVALAGAVWLVLMALGDGYRQGLRTELDRAGVQLMIVPLGCPYDAAARVLKGRELETSLPADVLQQVRSDPDVALAAPLLIAAVPRVGEKRADLWVGLDTASIPLRPWWQAAMGKDWFTSSNGVVLGSESAVIEMRSVGDSLHSPELDHTFRVDGILRRSGTSDDSLFFIPLAEAQRLFGQEERLTAIAVRLHDPNRLRAVIERFREIPGTQVVTMTEMMGTFLRLLGTVRSLTVALTLVACAVGGLGIVNTLLAAVVERAPELCLMRALGASRGQVMGLVILESLAMTALGLGVGVLLALALGHLMEPLLQPLLPLAPLDHLLDWRMDRVGQCLGAGVLGAVLAALLPAVHAGRLAPADAVKPE
jgi:putative ABC transport system permease protein